MVLERPELFTRKAFFWFLFVCTICLLINLANEYRAYKSLTRFDDALVDAEVRNQYLKSKAGRTYYVLKLETQEGLGFYTTGPQALRQLTGYRLQLRIRTSRLDFTGYLKGSFLYSDIVKVYPERAVRTRLADGIAEAHSDQREGMVYAALFTASPMSRELRQDLAALGVSHLLAISGFHLGVISFVLYLLSRPVAVLFQSRYVPYFHRNRMLFLIVASVLMTYLVFLEFVPSLLRAFTMMVVGYLFYDRGLKVLSIQTLATAVILLLALWPRLFFSIGLWLSVGGVYFILLFLHYCSSWNKAAQFVGIHVWVYLMMLPLSLWLFGIYSPMHPLSIVWSMAFLIFYPAALLAHVIGLEGLLDGILSHLFDGVHVSSVSVAGWVVALQLASAAAALYTRHALWLLLGMTVAVFVGAVYQVA